MEQKQLTRQELEALVQELFSTVPGNIVSEQIALSPECIGAQMYDAPILKIAAADDPLFEELKKDGVIGPWACSPKEFLPNAESVIALFFPFTEEVRKSNLTFTTEASNLWRHARHDGQIFQNALVAALKAALEERGYAGVIPVKDAHFFTVNEGDTVEGCGTAEKGYYGSSWSERHACYIAGLGTFCLSKGLISEKGISGRYSTLITDLPMEADKRPYTGLMDYCIACGECAKRCPANAIDPVTMTKDHSLCFHYQAATKHVHPYSGCGLCQVNVPCETCIPTKA